MSIPIGTTRAEKSLAILNAPQRAQSVQAPAVIVINLALKDGKFYLGELPSRLRGDAVEAVERDSLLKLITPLIKASVADAIGALPCDKGFLSMQTARDAGLPFQFDMEQMTLLVLPSVDQRMEGHIKLGSPEASAKEQSAAPAALSGFVNLHAGAQYTSTSVAHTRGLSSQTLGMSGAIRLLNVVIENEASISPGLVVRQGTRAVYDDPVSALRTTVGDVTPGIAGAQGGTNLLGVSVQKSYQKLQPQASIRPIGQRSFRLERPSNVDIVVNGQVVRRLQLPPGNHDISDLPLKAGENVLRLEITDDTGAHRSLDFTVFFDNTLLAPGVSEWGVAAGIKSTGSLAGITYAWNAPAITGYYQRGLTETTTGTAHFQADERAVMAGLIGINQSSIGSLSLESAVSARLDGALGVAAKLAYTPETLFKTWTIPGSLQLALNYRSAAFTTILSSLAQTADDLSLNAQYNAPLPDQYLLALSTSVSLSPADDSNRAGGGISLTKLVSPAVSWSLEGSYQRASTGTNLASSPAWGSIARLNIKLGTDTELAISRNGNGAAISEVSTNGSTLDGHYTLKAGLENDPPSLTGGKDQVATEISGAYSGARFDVAASNARRSLSTSRSVISDVSLISGSTSVAFADGTIAVGRPVTDSFAIVTAHPSLSDATLRVAPSETGVRGASDALGPAFVSDLPSYSQSQLPVTADNAPAGYDLGSGVFDVKPPYKSGYVLTVGSDYYVSAIGSITAQDGTPLALLSGLATELGVQNPHKVAIFTNRAGKFSADGLKAGTWTIELVGDAPTCFQLTIPIGTSGVFDAGRLAVPCH